jgi:hypothetical protein
MAIHRISSIASPAAKPQSALASASRDTAAPPPSPPTPHPPKTYLIFYRSVDDGIEIMRVVSGYQDLRALFDDGEEI